MSDISSRIMMISTHGYVSGSPEFGRPDTGGQVVYVLELSRWLGRLGLKVDIYTRLFENSPSVEEVDENVRIIRIPCGGRDFIEKERLCRHIPEWVSNASRWIRLNGLTYSTINSHYWDAGLAGDSLAAQYSIPHIHTPHSLGSWKRDNMPGSEDELEEKYNFRQRISSEQRIYNQSAAVIATTALQRDILVSSPYHTAPQKVQLIPAGYDDNRFFPVSEPSRNIVRRQLGLEGKVVLAVGRLARNKGYDLLIRAMKPVCDRLAEARLVLAVGSTALNSDERRQMTELKMLAESLGLSDRVIFRGYVPDDELANLYRSADVFALSSRYEPFGMTAIEAMACGVPTIVTTEGGLWAQVKWGTETLYANPNDPEAFGHSILDILQYPEIARQLSMYGSAKVRSEFTWSKIAQDFLNICNDAATLTQNDEFDSVAESRYHDHLQVSS